MNPQQETNSSKLSGRLVKSFSSDEFSFGKYKGEKVEDVFQKDQNYIVFMAKKWNGLGRTGYGERVIRLCYRLALDNGLIEPLNPIG